MLSALATRVGARRVLELGCGTGRALPWALAAGAHGFGLDLSFGMLCEAAEAGLEFVQAEAGRPPFAPASFDLVFCHNAFHHFPDKPGVAAEAFGLLRPGGAFATIGCDPREMTWFVYDYFDGALALDMSPERDLSIAGLEAILREAGFAQVASPVGYRVQATDLGAAVLKNTFLPKDSNSTLTLLSDEAYAAGLARITAAIAAGERTGQPARFETDFPMRMVHGFKPG